MLIRYASGRFAMLIFKGGSGPIPDATVAAAEERLGVTLPGDYKRFLREFNGGWPDPSRSFTVADRGDVMLGVMYGIKEERTSNDLEHEQPEVPLPPGLIVIGEDPGGNRVLLGTSGKDAGQVFFWDWVGLWVREDGRNLFPVAASFTAFVASLRE